MIIRKIRNGVLFVLEQIFGLVGLGGIVKKIKKEIKEEDLKKKYKIEILDFLERYYKKRIDFTPKLKDRKSIYLEAIKNNVNMDKEGEIFLYLLALSINSKKYSLNEEFKELFNDLTFEIDSLGICSIHESKPQNFFKFYYDFKKEKLESFSNLKKETVSNYDLARDYFLNYYPKGLIFMNYSNQNKMESIEELNKTLLYVIQKGELNAYGLTKEILSKVRKMDSQKEKSNIYLIMGNKINPQVKIAIKRFAHIGGVNPYSHVPGYENLMLSLFLIKTKEYYSSPKDFYKKIILQNVNSKEDSIISVMEVSSKNNFLKFFPKNEEFKSEKMKECLNIIKSIQKENSYEENLWVLLSKINIKLEEILPLLPFTILIKELQDSERIFLINNYSEIKSIGKIEKLSDWKKKSKEEISQLIKALGFPKYNEEEKALLYGGEISDEKINKRFLEFARQIKENADKFDYEKRIKENADKFN